MYRIPDPQELPPLSAQEEARPYAHYYYLGAAQPEQHVLEQLNPAVPMQIEYALLPEQLNKLLAPGYLPGETGWCVLPNGVGYAAVNTKLTGVTPEMNDWWGPWHEQEDLRYKLWCPGVHQRVAPGWAQENVGVGLLDLYTTHRAKPEEFGFDPEQLKRTEGVAALRCSNWLTKSAAGTPEERPVATAVLHYVRTIPGGIEYRSRFWIGMHIRQGKAIVSLENGLPIAPERAWGLAIHCAYEMATLGRLLPDLYPAYKAFH